MRGQQGAQIVGRGHGGQAGEHVAQVGMGIVAAALAGDDERVEHGGAVAGVGVADEEPVLRPEFARADGVLHGVGVELGAAVRAVSGAQWPSR